MKARFVAVLALAILVVLLAPLGSGLLFAQDPAQSPTAALVSQLQQQSEDAVQVAQHAETGKVRFIGTDPQHSLPRPASVTREGSPEQAARAFLSIYGLLFGISDQASELAVSRQRSIAGGRSVVRFQQRYQGVPVLAGEMNVQMDANKNVLSANGEVLPDLTLDTTAKVSAEQAKQTALQTVARAQGLQTDDLTASTPELWIYNPALLGGPGPRVNALVWRMDVTPKALAPIRELVLVDAHLGLVPLHFNQVDTARNRLTYTADNFTTLPGTQVCAESGCTGAADTQAQKAHQFAGSTYDMYHTEYNRDSIDGAGMTIKSTVHYDSNLANAFWDGAQMVYGDAFAFPLEADVVAHELTHGVTQNESHLFYYYQSGAINEALSDLWGEYVDQFYANDGSGTTNKWLIGEDIPGLGAIRSMQDPTVFGDPDRMTSPHYECTQSEAATGEGDNGGVHTNSGINNKAVFLMSDGGTFNGKTVQGIGYQKVAKLYYEVQTNLLLSGSDYGDLYNLLQQAASNLGFTAAEKASVKNALDAVEMNQQPTACARAEAAICPAGQSPQTLFADDMENGASKWVHGFTVGADNWFLPQNPNALGWDVTYATSGAHNVWGFGQTRTGSNIIVGTSDSFIAMSSSVALPASGAAFLRFNHAFGFEATFPDASARFDGGIVEYSANGGQTWQDAKALFDTNGYNGTLDSRTTNPLAGRQAFSADSFGYETSRLNLSPLAGQSVRFRFRLGTDDVGYDYGWFIDDVSIYRCAIGGTSTPTPTGGTPTPTGTPTHNGASQVYLPFVEKAAPTATPTPTPTLTPTVGPSWTTITSVDFESSLPGGWYAQDDSGQVQQYYWARSTCRPFQGSASGWAIGGGDGGSSLSCGASYPHGDRSWLVYGPFSLQGATAGDFSFKLWANTVWGTGQMDSDWVFYGVGLPNTLDPTLLDFTGWMTGGNTQGWVDANLNLGNIDDQGTSVLGQREVYVAILFSSEHGTGTQSEGAYVDDVVLRTMSAASSLLPRPSARPPLPFAQFTRLPAALKASH